MAKGSAMGIWRGRKGSSVFYYIKNSSNAQKQGIRERNYEVSNPKSYAQAGQRMKLLAVQRFYNQQKEVLQRGWEGVAYGTPTRRKFLKYALKTDLAKIASITKDATVVPPSELLVSRGSLCECSFEHWENVNNQVILGIHVPFISHLRHNSLEQRELLTQEIIENYKLGGGKEGDQFTILYCILREGVFIYGNTSWLMKTGETIPEINEMIGITNQGDDAITLDTVSPLWKLVGAAVIVSREEGTKHLRSTSTFYVNQYHMQDYFSNSARLNARRSYMKSEVLNNDWPADPEDATDGEGNQLGTIGFSAINAGHGTVDGTGTFAVGDVITLTAHPAEHYETAWYADQAKTTLLGTANTLELTVQPGTTVIWVEWVAISEP